MLLLFYILYNLNKYDPYVYHFVGLTLNQIKSRILKIPSPLPTAFIFSAEPLRTFSQIPARKHILK